MSGAATPDRRAKLALAGLGLAALVGIGIAFRSADDTVPTPIAAEARSDEARSADVESGAQGDAMARRDAATAKAAAADAARRQVDAASARTGDGFVRVTTVDWDGVPIGGATISVNARTQSVTLPSSSGWVDAATSDESGRARVTRADTHRWLLAKHDSGAASEVMLLATEADDLVAVLLPPLRIRGRVLRDDGSPAAFAVVRVQPGRPRGTTGIATARAAEDGSFAFDVDVPGPWRVFAEAHERTTPEVQFDLPQPDLDVVLRFATGGIVHGVVCNADGTPSVGTITAFRDRAMQDGGGRMRLEPISVTAATDAGGRFRLEVPSLGRYRLVAARDQHVRSATIAVDITAARRRADVELRWMPTGSLSGIVRMADGTPVVGAHVRASPEPERAESEESEISRREQFGIPAEQETDAEGRFTIPVVHTTTAYEVTVRPPRTPTAVSSLPTRLARAGDDMVFETPTAESTPTLPVVMTTADGRRIDRASVRVFTFEGERLIAATGAQLTVDGDGRQRIELPFPLTSAHALLIAPHRMPNTVPFVFRRVVPGPDGVATLQTPAATGLTVHVVGSDGRPRAGLDVHVTQGYLLWNDQRTVVTPTDADGTARFENFAPGAAVVTVSRRRERDRPLHVERVVLTPRTNELRIQLR